MSPIPASSLLIPAGDAAALGMGAVLGALSRYQLGRLAAEQLQKRAATDPAMAQRWTGWHTAGINIGGSFLLGVFAATPTLPSRPPPTAVQTPTRAALPAFVRGMSPRTKLMLGVGFCGSFTTFSTYSVDVVTWLSQGQTGKALQYVAVNNVGGIVAAACGMALVKRFFG